MATSDQVGLYITERGPDFLARATRDAAERFGEGVSLAYRNPSFFGETEPFRAVYVEERFAAVVAAYTALGVPVFTLSEVSHENEQVGQQQVDQGDQEAGAAGAEHRAGAEEESAPPVIIRRRGRNRGR